MHAAFCPKYVGSKFDIIFDVYRMDRSTTDFDLSGYFEPYVKQWLKTTDDKTGQWVYNVCRYGATFMTTNSETIL